MDTPATVADTQEYANFFWWRVRQSIVYWHDYVTEQAANPTVLNEVNDQILRSILFGLQQTDAWPTVVKLIQAFAVYMERTGRWEAWQTILEQALTNAHQRHDLASIVKLSTLQARLAQRQSRFKEAIAAYRRTIRLARHIGDGFNEARSCSNLGYFYVDYGYWNRAEVLCCHALAIFERLDSNHGQAHTENHLGALYTRQRKWELAQQYFERACERWEKMGDDHGLMYGFMNFGTLYNDMECADKALTYSKKALQQAKITKEELVIGTITMNIGVAYRIKNEPAKAEAYAWQAEAIFRRFSNTLGLALVHDNLGLVCLDQGKWEEAQQHLSTALVSWRSHGNKLGECRALGYIVELELAKGDRQKAAVQLKELEDYLLQKEDKTLSQFLEFQLEKYRRILTEYISQTATSSVTKF